MDTCSKFPFKVPESLSSARYNKKITNEICLCNNFSSFSIISCILPQIQGWRYSIPDDLEHISKLIRPETKELFGDIDLEHLMYML